jgi:hypothetical protein
MMPKRSHKRRSGKTGNLGGGKSTVRLVVNQKTTLYGRQTLSTISTDSSGLIDVAPEQLDPITLGDRPALVAAAFQRYRFKWIKFYFKSRLASDFQGKFYMGVQDDVGVANPTVADQILNYRSSIECTVWKDATLLWKPVDPSMWRYLRAESGGDARFIKPATFILDGDGTAVTFASAVTTTLSQAPLLSSLIGTVDIEFCIVYDGATKIAD